VKIEGKKTKDLQEKSLIISHAPIPKIVLKF